MLRVRMFACMLPCLSACTCAPWAPLNNFKHILLLLDTQNKCRLWGHVDWPTAAIRDSPPAQNTTQTALLLTNPADAILTLTRQSESSNEGNGQAMDAACGDGYARLYGAGTRSLQGSLLRPGITAASGYRGAITTREPVVGKAGPGWADKGPAGPAEPRIKAHGPTPDGPPAPGQAVWWVVLEGPAERVDADARFDATMLSTLLEGRGWAAEHVVVTRRRGSAGARGLRGPVPFRMAWT
jgi:hypothetical protein